MAPTKSYSLRIAILNCIHHKVPRRKDSEKVGVNVGKSFFYYI